MSHDSDELDHLKRGHVLLPPDVLLVLRTHSGQHVVRVHEDVDESVELKKCQNVTLLSELLNSSRKNHIFQVNIIFNYTEY